MLLIQKGSAFTRLAPGLAEHSIATCQVPYPTPTRQACEAIRRVGRALRAPLFWFGDLDPIGLMAFEILRAARVRYVGIDDRWLASVLRSPERRSRAVQPMGDEERQHFQRLVGQVKDLRTTIGQRSYELITSGKKLEVEGLLTITPTSLRLAPAALARRIRATSSAPRRGR